MTHTNKTTNPDGSSKSYRGRSRQDPGETAMNETNWKTARAIRVDGKVYLRDGSGFWWIGIGADLRPDEAVEKLGDITVIIDAEGRNVEAETVQRTLDFVAEDRDSAIQVSCQRRNELDAAYAELAEAHNERGDAWGKVHQYRTRAERAEQSADHWRKQAEAAPGIMHVLQSQRVEARRELAEEKAGRLTWQERAEELQDALTAAQARAGERAKEDHRLDQAAEFLAETMPRVATPEHGETFESAGRYLRRILDNIRADRS